jgi:HKD family nuclease
MEKTVKLTEKEIEVLKDALETQKVIVRIKTATDNQVRKEKAINELYELENVERKVGK